MGSNIPNLEYILNTIFLEPNKLIQGGAPIDFKLMRLMNTYISWKEVTDDKKQLVLQRQKWHDAVKPIEKKKSKGKGSSSSNPEPDPLLEATEAFAQTQTNFKAAIRSFIPRPNFPLTV
ncbi:hypothetical protein Pyn_14160 [Prunus yedoensis var. nudiflora]|uniref:Uncharacterized protein n=1 Tax=Prunus yedoensis var. nudiflora TaxID=2094558 RepID=A0A314XQK6_PRUYE|nr:hypothetical protein Pyn_14160 [Prunus yedoensis var. nudiflora]